MTNESKVTSAPPRFTALIAEDEALFRDALIEMLKQEWPELDLVAICEDGAAALDALSDVMPDIAFLDIRMPGLTGLEVATAMASVSPITRIVFVTAYDQYAIDAFEKGAVDYLLKPVARERLAACVARLKSQLLQQPAATAAAAAQTSTQQEIIALLAKQLAEAMPTSTGTAPLTWLTSSSGRETRLIMVDDVIYFQSDQKYTVVMTAKGESILRTPLSDIIARLDMKYFRQIHRGTVVNMRAVATITRDAAGRGQMKLKDRPETLAVSLTFMSLFKNM